MAEPQKIALIVRWPTGGIRTHLKYLYRYLRPGAYQPVLVAPPGTETDFLIANLGVTPENTVIVSEAGGVAFARAVWQVCAGRRVDLVHSHGFTSAAVAGPIARLRGKPHVATIHDVVTDTMHRRLGWFGLRALSASLGFADIVHAVGADAADNLRTLPKFPLLRAPRLVAVRNGVDISQFTGVTARDFKAELGLTPDVFLLGFFGRFMAQKGFRVLIEAVQRLSQRPLPRPLVVVAAGEGGFLREDRDEVKRRGLDAYFRFVPPLENPAPSLLALDCLVMPSRWEALSVLAMEILCLGTPLIASSCIGLREVIENTPARAVPPGDAEALAQAIFAELSMDRRAEFERYAPIARAEFDVRRGAAEIEKLFAAAARA
jgi:glycosyltransferase involved in cell wall biosynthesis